MMAVKTNEEYRALQHEIEHAQSGIRKIEDDILNLMMEAETGQTDVKTAKRTKAKTRSRSMKSKQLEEQNKRDLSAPESYLKERKEIEPGYRRTLSRTTSASGSIAVESVLPQRGMKSATSVRSESAGRCTKKSAKTIRSSLAMPANAFCTIPKIPTIHLKWRKGP